MKVYFWIALGSALGGMLRHGISSWISGKTPGVFPWGTLLVNISGSFLIGLIAVLPESRFPGPNAALIRQFLTVGILGGFTTFSAFSLQTLMLFHEGRLALGFSYITASVLFCILGAGMGWWLGGFTLR